MEESYREIFEEAMICEDLRELVDLYAITDKHSVIMLWNETTERIVSLCNRISVEDRELATTIMNAATLARESFDNDGYMQYVLQDRLIPGMMRYLERYRSIDVDDGYWSICGTPSGFVSLKCIESGMYLHSAYDPMNEAYLLANNLYKVGQKDFYFFGCGLGYLPYQMWKISNGSVKVHICEYKSEMVEYAHLFGPIDLIDEDMLDIQLFPDFAALVNEYTSLISGDHKYDAFPSGYFQSMVQSEYGDRLDSWFAIYRTAIVSEQIWSINRSFNRELIRQTHLDIPSDILKAEWLVVAAGPSFDENIDFLRNSVGKRTIIAVSTVIPRLEREDIRPDLIIVCDPYKSIYPHVKGHEAFTEGIPLIAHAQTYWKFIKSYRGPLYLMAQAGDETEPDIEYPVWNSGGTVTSMAIEAACLMGAERVYVMGMDLAYPGGVRYSKGMNDQDDPETETLPMARSNDGSMVYSAVNFLLYSGQIRDQVKYHQDIEIWNLSKHGLYIPLMRTGKWWEEGIGEDALSWIDNIGSDEFLNWREKYYLLRQLLDSNEVKLTDEEIAAARKLVDELADEMIAQIGLPTDKCLKRGKNIEVIIASSTDEDNKFSAFEYLDHHSMAGKAALIINTRERLSGERVYLRGESKRSSTPALPSNGVVTRKGQQYAYFQIADSVASADQYMEILEILIGQNGINVHMADEYSLFGAWIEKLIR